MERQPVLFREQLEGLHRWAAPPMDPPKPVSDAPARPTVAELEALQEHARQEGYAAGLAEGREAAQHELNTRVESLHVLCDALARPLADVDEGVEQELAALAALIARRVVCHELSLHPEHLLAVVRQSLAAMPASTQQLRIFVHPDDVALLGGNLGDIGERGWRIVEDDTLERGDCRIEGEGSRLDARTCTRLAAIIDAALGEVATPVLDDAGGETP